MVSTEGACEWPLRNGGDSAEETFEIKARYKISYGLALTCIKQVVITPTCPPLFGG